MLSNTDQHPPEAAIALLAETRHPEFRQLHQQYVVENIGSVVRLIQRSVTEDNGAIYDMLAHIAGSIGWAFPDEFKTLVNAFDFPLPAQGNQRLNKGVGRLLLRQAKLYNYDNDAPTAQGLAREALRYFEANSPIPGSIKDRAECHELCEEFSEALSLLEQIDSPGQFDLYARARILTKNGQHREARVIMLGILEHSENRTGQYASTFLSLMSEVEEKLGNIESSISNLSDAVQVCDDDKFRRRLLERLGKLRQT